MEREATRRPRTRRGRTDRRTVPTDAKDLHSYDGSEEKLEDEKKLDEESERNTALSAVSFDGSVATIGVPASALSSRILPDSEGRRASQSEGVKRSSSQLMCVQSALLSDATKDSPVGIVAESAPASTNEATDGEPSSHRRERLDAKKRELLARKLTTPGNDSVRSTNLSA